LPPAPTLPDLALGLPSEVAERRPDIRAAESRLRSATASIGVAEADLYPSIRLGAKFGYESFLGDEFTDWGSRTWSIGPMLDLPIFDHGRRKSVVELRTLQQQEAAVAYHKTVLQAWGEIDDALSGYTAERQETEHLKTREDSLRDAYELADAKYKAGVVDFLVVLDAQRNWLQARRDRADSEGSLAIKWAAVNKAIGNTPRSAG
jgi:outer membrane protein TolC